MKKIYSVIGAFVLLAILMPDFSVAQSNPMNNQQDRQAVEFFVDYATFKAPEDDLFLEVYLLIPRQQLSFVESDTLDRYEAQAFVQVGLAQNDSVKHLDRWPINDAVDDVDEVTETQNLPDIATFQIPPGEYELIAQVIDVKGNKRGTFREPISVRSFGEEELEISDIEFASIIQPTDEPSIFTKVERNIVPNASLTYGVNMPVLYSYAEVYNMEYPSDADSFEVQYSVLDLNNAEVKSPQTLVKKKAGESSVDIGGLNIVGLQSGIYFYRVRVTDLETGNVATRSKKFYVYKPGERLQASGVGSPSQNYAGMGEDELDDVFDTLSPILTNREKRNYKRAGIEGKRNLLAEFWDSRDPDPSTSINELQIEYGRRLEHVDQTFGNQQTDSYNTDRGRVYLIYGEPDEVERNPLSVDIKPYETWYYHSVQGGVEFIFVDKTGFGVYELVHSTARNELYDPNWQRFLQTGSGSF